MTNLTKRVVLATFIPVLLSTLAGVAQAQSAASDADSTDDSDQSTSVEHHHHRRHRVHAENDGKDLFSLGSDSVLAAGKHAESVVAILGSAIAEGDADSVVSILGSTRVAGRLTDSAVAVLGNTYGGDFPFTFPQQRRQHTRTSRLLDRSFHP